MSQRGIDRESPASDVTRRSRPITLLPPPRDRGMEESVDLGAVMRAPLHLPQFDRDAGELDQDLTPAPLVLSASVAPVSVSSPPVPDPMAAMGDVRSERGWRYATFALAGLLLVGSAAIGATRLASWQNVPSNSSIAAQPSPMTVDPLTISVNDLPVVGVVEPEKPAPLITTLSETSDRESTTREERARGDEDRAIERRASETEVVSVPAPNDEHAPTGDEGEGSIKPSETDEPPAAPASARPPFDRTAAAAAVGAAAGAAASCREPGSPSGAARVAVTFAPSGRVTTATIAAGQYAGTSVGGCIARAIRSARVEPFSGDLVTVHKTITLP